jgi:hypothetical protein
MFTVLSLFYILSLLLNTLSPLVLKFSYTIRKEKLLWLSAEPVMHRFLYFIIICKLATSQSLFQGSKKMKIRRCEVWTVWRVVENLKFQFLKGFLGMGCRMRAGIVQQKDSLRQSSSTEQINTCEFQPLSHPLPIKANHSPLFFLGANWKQCCHVHGLNATDALCPRLP